MRVSETKFLRRMYGRQLMALETVNCKNYSLERELLLYGENGIREVGVIIYVRLNLTNSVDDRGVISTAEVVAHIRC